MRPFQIILLAVFGFLAVAGLIAFATFKGFSGNGPSVGTVVIWGTLPASSVNAALDDYKRSHQSFGQVSYVEEPAESFESALADAIASGRGPALILISQEQLLAEESRLTVIPESSISERAFRGFLPESELFLTEGGTYGIPVAVDPLVLFYNRQILASAGLAQPPQNWEAVTGAAPMIAKQTDAGQITRAFVPFGVYENYENARALLSLLFLQSGTPISAASGTGVRSALVSGNATYGSRPAESALDFFAQFAMPQKTVYSWNRSFASARQAFLAGSLALYPGFASERGDLASANPNLDFDMAPMPQPGTSDARVTYGRVYAFAIPKSSGNPQGAFLVASTLASGEVGPALARANGMAPALRSALVPSPKDVYEPVYFPEALIAQGWLSPAPSQVDSIFAGMMRDIVSGRANAKEALQTADQNLDAALR